MSDLKRAKKLYEQFREAPAQKARTLRYKVPAAAAVMGHCEFIGYRTSHGGKLALYIHEFAPGSRPLLAAGPDHSQLLLVGGRFKVTELGITDLNAKGRVVRARRQYVVKRKI